MALSRRTKNTHSHSPCPVELLQPRDGQGRATSDTTGTPGAHRHRPWPWRRGAAAGCCGGRRLRSTEGTAADDGRQTGMTRRDQPVMTTEGRPSSPARCPHPERASTTAMLLKGLTCAARQPPGRAYCAERGLDRSLEQKSRDPPWNPHSVEHQLRPSLACGETLALHGRAPAAQRRGPAGCRQEPLRLRPLQASQDL